MDLGKMPLRVDGFQVGDVVVSRVAVLVVDVPTVRNRPALLGPYNPV